MILDIILQYCSFFLFKQKTAYEMRISDWSSDVCSSDLMGHRGLLYLGDGQGELRRRRAIGERPARGQPGVRLRLAGVPERLLRLSAQRPAPHLQGLWQLSPVRFPRSGCQRARTVAAQL